jgi:hypothetical protein
MRARGFVALVIAALALTPVWASAEERPAPAAAVERVADLDALLAGCAKMPGLFARFAEEKQIALLAVPLKSSGTIHFDRARGLVRHTLLPSKQSVQVTDKELVFWDGKNTRHVSLASSATVEAFARAFTLLLSADRTALEKSFELTFTPKDSGASWSLSLVPKNAELKSVVASMEIEGRGLVVTLLKVREANGDLTTSRFSDVDTAKRYSDEEAGRTFRVPPP